METSMLLSTCHFKQVDYKPQNGLVANNLLGIYRNKDYELATG